MKAFTFDPAPSDAFVRLGDSLDREDGSRLAPTGPRVRALLDPAFPFYQRPGADHCRFLASAGGRPVARAVASIHPELRDRDGTPVGAVGLFEAVSDEAAPEDVLAAAVDWLAARGRRRIWGPVDFDIWHGYRFMTRGFELDRFLGEPCNPPRYPDCFERFGFRPKRRWNSFDLGGAEDLARLSAPWAGADRRLRARGYRFEPWGGLPLARALEQLHRAVSDSFSGFLGFTPLPFDEFLEVLGPGRLAVETSASTFAYDEAGRLAGFATVFRDLAGAVRAAGRRPGWRGRLGFWLEQRRARRLMVHLGGITRAEARRHTGLPGALFHHTVGAVRRAGYPEVLATLVARGNPMRRYYGEHARDTSREYTLFELQR